MTKELVRKLIFDGTEENISGKERNNVVELHTVTGGKGPTDFHPNDWLSPLPNGTIFLFNDKKNYFDPNLGQARILNRTEKAIYLGFIVNGQPMQGPVDPIKFCTKYSMFENLGKLIEQEEQEEDLNERDRLQGDPRGSDDLLDPNETLQGEHQYVLQSNGPVGDRETPEGPDKPAA